MAPLIVCTPLPQVLYDIKEHFVLIIDSPLSLLRLCRVTVRQMMGPATFDTMLPSFELPSSLEDFMKQMKQMCDDRLIKQAALQGLSEEYWKEREAQALL